jgi:hypothetical protein
MSQSDYGTINATTKSGTQLATDLNNQRDARDSMNSGATAPTYKVAGLVWLDTAATPWLIKQYDGTDWVTLYSYNASTNKVVHYHNGVAQGSWSIGNSEFLTKSGAYTLVAADRGKPVAASGTWSLALTAAATLADGWWCGVRNTGSGIITIDPDGAELINGAATLALAAGESAIIFCNGSGFYTVGYGPLLSNANTWGAPQRANQATVTEAALNLSTAQNFHCTPAAADTLEFSNGAAGQSGLIYFVNDDTNVITLGAECTGPADMASTISVTGNYLISYWVHTAGGGADTVALSFVEVL